MDIEQESLTSLTDLNIECNNLTHLTKLIVKDILRLAVKYNRQLDEDHYLIIQLLRVLEFVAKHGLKPKKLLNNVSLGVLTNSYVDPWPVLCDLLSNTSGLEIITSVQQMGLKTGLGKYRAWLKLAFMQKQLGDYFRIITEQTKKLESYYYPAALLLSEKGVEISGLLVGLSVIECNFIKFKETVTEFDNYLGVLNYSQYMNKDFDDGISQSDLENHEENEDQLQSMLDQKQYIEELNTLLNNKLQKYQNQVTNLEQELCTTKQQLKEFTSRGLWLSNELDKSRAESQSLRNLYEHRSKLLQDDLDVERNTYQSSRQELYQMNLELEKRIKEEINLRLENEKALLIEVAKKSDIELSMDSLEKQIQDKQMTIIGVRKQLEQIKSVNVELNTQIKDLQTALDHKLMLIDKLEEKTKGMSLIIDQMDQRIKKVNLEKSELEKVLFEYETEKNATETINEEYKSIIESLSRQVSEMTEQLNSSKQVNKHLTDDNNKLHNRIEYYELENRETKIRCQEQAEALEDMARLVENSKLESEGLREMQISIREAKWTDDKEVTDCNQCQRSFNVSRRKHHCRRCGGVYCHDCSSNRMPLASSSKPMRVCDTCLNILMKNYTDNITSSTASIDNNN